MELFIDLLEFNHKHKRLVLARDQMNGWVKKKKATKMKKQREKQNKKKFK